MRTDLSFRLQAKDAPEVTIDRLKDGPSYLTFDLPEHDLTLYGTEQQIAAIVSQFKSEHTRQLTDALRRVLNMPEASDLEVLLRASIREAA